MRSSTRTLLWLVVLLTLSLFACSNENNEEVMIENFNVQFEIPSSMDVEQGGKCVFKVKDGKMPQVSDSFIMESDKGISYVCPFIDISSEGFTVQIPNDCETGYYKVAVRRDERKKLFGQIHLSVGTKLDFIPDAGTTIYGRVSSEEGAVKNVVVSDGVEVTVTDENGIYQLKSKKKWKYVFISIPGDYEAPSKGVLPLFYQLLQGDSGTTERKDFTLKKVSGQDTYKVFMLGDMHLANRTDDSRQFLQFTSDLNGYRAAHSGEKMYAITLGDMTWDLYWYSNSYALPEYLNTINSHVKDLQIFHTIGNHDYDYKTASDLAAEGKYVNYIAPVYYSFNIGKIHYVIMDDIDCDNYDGTTSRNYKKRISQEQLEWLSKDLSYVNKTTPLVVVMHAQIFYPVENGGFKFDHDIANTTQLLNLLDGYQVHFVTGHTHLNFNVTPEMAIVDGHNYHEHNTGAVCGSWWWSGYLTPDIHISPDGTPGGYGIWNISGTDIQWVYKATGWPETYQFRSYDLNNVHFSLADVPQMSGNTPVSVKDQYMRYVNAYPEVCDNEVLINIWNWNPRWKLNVVDEYGNTLTPIEVWAYDPLHIAALSVKRFNSSGLTSAPNFITEKFTHFFKVKAKDANSDLVITVKDEFDHTWKEEMQRPKEFSIDIYRKR